MLTREEIFTIVRSTAINSIANYIRNRQNTVPQFQILDIIIPTERRIRSVVGGMETSLGTTLWEPLAKNLARLNGFEIVEKNLMAPSITPGILQNTIQVLIEGRKSTNSIYSAKYCQDRIQEICQSFLLDPIVNFKAAPKGFGVDIWLIKNDVNYFFDTKTVQSNLGSYSKYFEQILNWYGYFYASNPSGNAFSRIVFPYNPHKDCDFWKKTVGNGFPLEPKTEGWVQNEFWDFCSGFPNTFEIILSAFKDISEKGDLKEIIHGMFYGEMKDNF